MSVTFGIGRDEVKDKTEPATKTLKIRYEKHGLAIQPDAAPLGLGRPTHALNKPAPIRRHIAPPGDKTLNASGALANWNGRVSLIRCLAISAPPVAQRSANDL